MDALGQFSLAGKVAVVTGGTGVLGSAIAPGFFIGEQNRDLLLEADGRLTERGEIIIN